MGLRENFSLGLLLLIFALWLPVAGHADDTFVIDYNAGTGVQGALFRVDPVSGARTLLSDFGVGTNQGFDPTGVAVESNGQILVIDYVVGTGGQGALFRVDPVSGARTLLSDFGVGANQGSDPVSVAVESNGQILVIDSIAGTGFTGALFRVDPVSGARTLLSDFGVGTNQGFDPTGVAVESNGQILVTDPNAGTGGQGALFRVDPVSGARTLLSDFGVGANQGLGPASVAVFRQQSTSVPTMSEWGMIIFVVLAGLYSVYYLRRQRRTQG